MTAEEALARIRAFSRPASVAQIGGFRPPEDLFTSWFGGNFLGLPGENWPEGKSGPMIPLLQIRIDELPYCPLHLSHFQLVNIYFDEETIRTTANKKDGCLVRTYSTLGHLKPLQMPTPGNHWPKIFPIRWTFSPEDCPGWEDSWKLDEQAMEIINGSDDSSDAHGDLPCCFSTKVGGWPTYIQGAPNIDSCDFVIQIDSEEKPRWMLVDNGNIYLYCSEEGDWQMHLDFY
jgi:hypothetical protein